MLGASGTWGNHIGLEKKTLNDELLVNESFHDSGEDSLRSFSADLNVVVTVSKDLGFNDGNKTIVLADATVSGKTVSDVLDGNLRWSAVTNLANSSPLGESAAFFVVLLASLGKSIKTLGGLLVLGTTDDNKTLVDLNTGMDTTTSKELNKVLSVSSLLVKGLLEHDDT